MSPFLRGKSTLAPNLPLLQRLPVFRFPLPEEMLLNSSLEITVLELSGAGLVRFIQTFLPQRTAAAVFLFSIGEYIPLKFSLRAVMGGLGHNKKVNAQSFQHPVCQREVIGGVCRSGVQRNDIFMDIL